MLRNRFAGVLALLLAACPEYSVTINESGECCFGCEPDAEVMEEADAGPADGGPADSGPADSGPDSGSEPDADMPDAASSPDVNCDEDQPVIPFECVCDNEFCGAPGSCHPCDLPYPDGGSDPDAGRPDAE